MAIGDSTRINTNIAAFNALNALKSVNRNLEKSQLKLATGLRIKGYQMSEPLRMCSRLLRNGS